MPSKNGSVFVYSQTLFSRFLSSLVANIGVKVKATKEDIVTALWYNAERVDAEKIQRTIDSLLKTLQLKAERG